MFVTAKPADSSLDPAERPAKLYQRFLDENSWSHPGGLDRPRVRSTAARSKATNSITSRRRGANSPRAAGVPTPTRKTPNTCIYDFRLGGLDVEMRFSAALLAEWARLKAGARGLIEAARR